VIAELFPDHFMRTNLKGGIQKNVIDAQWKTDPRVGCAQTLSGLSKTVLQSRFELRMAVT
jgi:hypothetical protein